MHKGCDELWSGLFLSESIEKPFYYRREVVEWQFDDVKECEMAIHTPTLGSVVVL